MTKNSKQTAAIYLHVPKCGGTTLAAAIEGMYPTGATFKISQIVRDKLGSNWVKVPAAEREQYALEVLRAMPMDELRALRLITGHMSFGLHTSLPQGGRYICMLRDPVKLVVSLYRYILDLPAHPHKERILAEGLGVGEFSLSGINFTTDNTAVRRIAGIGESVPFGQCGVMHLQQAKANLDEYFDVVGITEHFDESLLLMKAALGWQKPPYYVSRNISTSKLGGDQLNEKDLERIREQNWLDMELYDYARARLLAQIDAAGPGFADELARFRAGNARRRHLSNSAAAVKQAIRGLIRRS